MLPLSLLRGALNAPILIELRNGDTYNGTLSSLDNFMNLYLDNVIYTSRDADKFVKLKQVYVRGNQIKYLRIPNEIPDKLQAEQDNQQDSSSSTQYQRGGFRGGRGGSQRGRGGRGGGRGGAGQQQYQQRDSQQQHQQQYTQRGRGQQAYSRGRGGQQYAARNQQQQSNTQQTPG